MFFGGGGLIGNIFENWLVSEDGCGIYTKGLAWCLAVFYPKFV